MYTSGIKYKYMTTMTGLVTKTVFTALRPPRVAIFLDNTDQNWKNTVLHIMNILPTFWGSDGYVLIPTDGESIHPHFEELLRAYDPDYVITYQRSGHDFRAQYPTKFKKYVDDAVKDHIARYPGTMEEEIRDHFEEMILRNAFERSLKFGKKIKNFILKDLAVFHYKEDVREQSLSFKGTTPHFLPRLVDVLRNSNKINKLKIVDLDLANFAIDFQLMGYGAAGKSELLTQSLKDERLELVKLLPTVKRNTPDEVEEAQEVIDKLARAEVPQSEKFSRSDASVLFKSIWERRADLEGMDFRGLWRSTVKTKKKKSTIVASPYDFFTRVPFRISSHGLQYFFRRKDYLMDEEGNPLVIVGDAIEDYCLYYSLTRLRRKVYWLPYSRLLTDSRRPNGGSYSFLLTHELNSEGRSSDRKEIHWTSISLGKTRLSRVPALIKKNNLITGGSYSGVSDHLTYVENEKKILPYLMRLYENKNANNRVAYQFLDGKGISYIDTPSPKSFKASNPLKHKWISEVSISGNIYPTSDFLSGDVFLPDGLSVFHTDTTATRVSRFAVHYQCPATGFISSNDEVDERLVRPMLNYVMPENIFKGYFDRAHYDIRLSDKGSYFQQVLSKLNGLDSLVSIIKNKGAFALFEKFVDQTESKKGVYSNGVFLSSEKRRYVDHSAVIDILKTIYPTAYEAETVELVNRLMGMGILNRGNIFRCKFCKNSSWYSPKDAGNNFTCKRCGEVNLVDVESLKVQPPEMRFEPIAYYQLNELFYQFWNSNGWLTALTLQKLKSGSEGSLIFMPETEFRKDPAQERPDFEMDLLAVVDGNLYFGEAKKDANSSNPKNKLSVNQIDRILSFNKFMPLKGLVFSSYSNKWPADVSNRFDEIDAKSQFELVKFGSVELL